VEVRARNYGRVDSTATCSREAARVVHSRRPNMALQKRDPLNWNRYDALYPGSVASLEMDGERHNCDRSV
jgi:hypothetical protein